MMDDFEKLLKEKFAERAARIEEEIRADKYSRLAEEDRKALELGRRILSEEASHTEEKKTVRSTRKKRRKLFL